MNNRKDRGLICLIQYLINARKKREVEGRKLFNNTGNLLFALPQVELGFLPCAIEGFSEDPLRSKMRTRKCSLGWVTCRLLGTLERALLVEQWGQKPDGEV